MTRLHTLIIAGLIISPAVRHAAVNYNQPMYHEEVMPHVAQHLGPEQNAPLPAAYASIEPDDGMAGRIAQVGVKQGVDSGNAPTGTTALPERVWYMYMPKGGKQNVDRQVFERMDMDSSMCRGDGVPVIVAARPMALVGATGLPFCPCIGVIGADGQPNDRRNWMVAHYVGHASGVAPALLIAIRMLENPRKDRDFLALGVVTLPSDIWGQYADGAKIVKRLWGSRGSAEEPDYAGVQRVGRRYAADPAWAAKVWSIYRRIR